MHIRLISFITLCGGLGWSPDAQAYIDPGTGSILVQGLIAAVAAIGVTLKLYWHKFVRLFTRSNDRDEQARSSRSEAVTSGKSVTGGDDE